MAKKLLTAGTTGLCGGFFPVIHIALFWPICKSFQTFSKNFLYRAMVLNFLNPGHLSHYSQATPCTQVTCQHARVHLCACTHTKTCIFSLQMIKKCVIINERLGLLE